MRGGKLCVNPLKYFMTLIQIFSRIFQRNKVNKLLASGCASQILLQKIVELGLCPRPLRLEILHGEITADFPQKILRKLQKGDFIVCAVFLCMPCFLV